MSRVQINGVYLDPHQDMVVRHYRTHGEFEPLSMRAWRAALKPGEVAVDVGAYTGVYAIAAALAGSESWAVEPNPNACKRLRENAMANGVSIRTICAAASNNSGARSLHMKGPLSSANTLHARYASTHIVETVRLDELLVDYSVCAIKMDIEGWELPALEGCAETLKRCRPLVTTEANTESSWQDQRSWFAFHGYRHSESVDLRNNIWTPRNG